MAVDSGSSATLRPYSISPTKVSPGELVRLNSRISYDPFAGRWGSARMGERLLAQSAGSLPRARKGRVLERWYRVVRSQGVCGAEF